MNLPPILSPPAGRPTAESAARVSRRLVSILQQVWDQLAIYLPLVLMGMLALLTYWMVRIAPDMPEPQSKKPPTHEVDFFMRGAVIKTYDPQGRLQSQLAGREMRHYADNATVEVDDPRWQGLTPQGRITRASAKMALSKDDGSEVQLIGQAVVRREAFETEGGRRLPQQEFRGEFLHIFADDERLLSHLPVEFTSGGDRFSANSFRYDHVSQVVELEGRVTAHIATSAERKR